MIRLGNRYVGGDKPCFVVAEAGLSHLGSLDRAKELVDAAVGCGAEAIKFQAYKTAELINKDRAPDDYERFSKRELSYDQLKELKAYAENQGILWFATGHTLGAVDFLRKQNVRLYKIGSAERDRRAFDRIINTGKPVFISTGMREHADILNLVTKYGGKNTAFLHCISAYPTIDGDANLGFLNTLRRWCDSVGSVCGYSDHMVGTYGVELAVAMGAKIVEKHIKVEAFKGRDNPVSLTPKEFGAMVKAIRRVETMVGEETRVYGGMEHETETWAMKGKDGKRPV